MWEFIMLLNKTIRYSWLTPSLSSWLGPNLNHYYWLSNQFLAAPSVIFSKPREIVSYLADRNGFLSSAIMLPKFLVTLCGMHTWERCRLTVCAGLGQRELGILFHVLLYAFLFLVSRKLKLLFPRFFHS